MNHPISDAIACSLRGFRLPRYHEIPDVGLYLEQTTKYVNQCIRPLGIEDVTSSMIRNYVKQGLITNPIHKQYSANQIAHLIALALLKQVSPLEHISNLFRLLKEGDSYTDPVAYNYFCEELENILYYRLGLKEAVETVGVTSSLEKEMLRSAVTAVSHIVYLNRCFHILEKQAEAVPSCTP
jgi:DNA-binding transcriptional MerR regulator